MTDEFRNLRRYFSIVPLMLAMGSGHAAEETLDEIVVTATRLETSVREAARAVSVVEKERIQEGTQQLGLDEALAVVPGLYMQNRYNFAQDLRISLRGFGARSSFGVRGVKLIVDGIPETLPDGQAAGGQYRPRLSGAHRGVAGSGLVVVRQRVRRRHRRRE
ncbi:MAG: TonB-dependent receptor plug domain-containing protein [Woeseiaceae bacterium]|nr:TonB-dependent receptor plug domain-containing protein [Woeseiaceae bacterium]